MGCSIHAKGIEMTSRNIVARIEKLEARQCTDDEMLLVWRMPGQLLADALTDANKSGLYGSNDLVICVEWHGESAAPPPCWCRHFPSDLTYIEKEYCLRELEKFEREGPVPKGPDYQFLHLSDEELWHMIFGVET
jgi:hypothetical protein